MPDTTTDHTGGSGVLTPFGCAVDWLGMASILRIGSPTLIMTFVMLVAVMLSAGPATARETEFDGTPPGATPATAARATGQAIGTGAACPPDVGTPFGDVTQQNVHHDTVACVAWWQIAQGRTADRYAPSAAVTRAQMASFIARLVERSGGSLPAAAAEDGETFRDLSAAGAHASSVRSLAAAGIVRGLADGTYGVNRSVTRAQMASFLVRAFEYRTGATLQAGADAFRDDDGSAHEQAINKAAAVGFTTGRTVGVYDPGVAVRRDQMASFVTRVLDRLVADGVASVPREDLSASQLCYSATPDRSGGKPLDGATVSGDIYVYLAAAC